MADLGADELIEVRGYVEEDPVYGSGQSDPTEEEDEQHEVGIGGREIHHLRQKPGFRGCSGAFPPTLKL